MANGCFFLGAGILLVASQVEPAAAQQKTVEEQKKEADLDLVRAQIDAANQKLLTDALTAAKQPREGSAGITSAENTAEGLILSDYILKRTALQLATDVQTWRNGQPGMSEDLLVVFGTSAPSVAQWIAYEKMVAQLASTLATATSDWEELTSKPAPPAIGERKFFVDPVSAASIAAVVGTTASLLKTDFAIGGSKLAPTSDELRGIVLSALSKQAVPFNDAMFEIAGTPSNVEKTFDTMTPAYKKAFAQYHDEYLPLLKTKGGKVENLTSSEAAAGRNLLTAMTDYQNLYKSLYTPVNDVLPATVLETQRLLFTKGSNQPVLYIFGSKAHLTTVTKKNLFSGIRSTPASLRAAGTMDYAIAYKGQTILNSAVFATQKIPFDRVPEYLGKGLENAEPSLAKR